MGLNIVRALEEHGLLLLTDARLPSVAAIVVGSSVRGSWWSHPQGRAIFAACEIFAHHPDALVTRIVSGKVTWVHRSLWNALLAVARERAPWQTRGLGRRARSCLDRIDTDGPLRCDQAGIDPAIALDLERRLLVHAEAVHTERGAHSRMVESWDQWARRARYAPRRMTPVRGRIRIESALALLNERFRAKGTLPWPG